MTGMVPAGVAEMLRGGATNAQVAARFHMAKRRVAGMRDQLGLPPARRHRGAPSLQAAFHARVRPLDGGHAEWTGPRNANGVPMVCWKFDRVSAYRVAFRIEYGREPQGVVLPVCDVPGCVAGRCLDDGAARRRTRGQLAAVLGLNHTSTHCREGHPYDEHGVFKPDGVRYCGQCDSDSNKARKRGTAA